MTYQPRTLPKSGNRLIQCVGIHSNTGWTNHGDFYTSSRKIPLERDDVTSAYDQPHEKYATNRHQRHLDAITAIQRDIVG